MIGTHRQCRRPLAHWTFAWLVVAIVVPVARGQSTEAAGDGSFRLLLMAAQGPVTIELRLALGERSLTTAWSESMANTFNYLDLDKNGAVNGSELQGVEWSSDTQRREQTGLGRLLNGLFRGESTAASNRAGDDRQAFARRYQRAFPQVRVVNAMRPNVQPVDLWSYLDRNQDGGLSTDEVAQLWKHIRMLDRNVDETVSVFELLQFENPFARGEVPQYSGQQRLPSQECLLLTDETLIKAAGRLVERYDLEASDGKLDPRELPWTPGGWQRWDANADRLLEFDELHAWVVKSPPDLSITAQLQSVGDKQLTIASSTPSEQIRVVSTAGRAAACAILGSQVAIEIESPVSGDYLAVLKQQFAAADADNNKYLDMDEARTYGFVGQYFQQADRDRDEKLYEDELIHYVQQRQQIHQNRAVVSVVRHGRDLFTFLDRNVDGRLVPRERQLAVDHVRRWDRNSDGRLVPDEIPEGIRLVVSRGSAANLGAFAGVASVVSAWRVRLDEPDRGPDWFRKLDRNRDGDVSRGEFIGPVELFKRLDRDGDGLIDAREADGS